MPVAAVQGEKQIASAHGTAVQRQPEHRLICQFCRHLGKTGQQFSQIQWRSGVYGAAPAIFMVGRLSGVMLRMRSALAIVWPNTGAATVPP